MDLRTKLVFALVGVSLGSMLALGGVGYFQGRSMLRDASLDKLSAIAESRKQDLENVLAGWGDRVSLIGSRTQLRLSLAAYNATGNASERRRMNRILDDARGSVASVDFLAVFAPDGNLVAASWADPSDAIETELAFPVSAVPAPGDTAVEAAVGRDAGPPAAGRRSEDEGPTFLGLEIAEDGRRQVRYVSPLVVDDSVRVGWLLARLSAAELLTISRDHTGVGQTGETIIFSREPEGLRVLHQVRHRGLAGGSWIPERVDALDPATVAAAGRDTVLWDGVTDYRGAPVWAATRYLAGPDWGIVVKADAAEESAPIIELRNRMLRLALSLSAFAILGGILLGLQLTRPVQELVEVASLIVGGQTDARADVRTQDEIGLLARVFNRMADALTARDVSISDDELAKEVEAAREQLARENEHVTGG